MEYLVHEFERKKKKSKRSRRIAVVEMNSYVWFPSTVDYSSRVKLDGGTVEGYLCLNLAILKLHG